MRQGKFTTAVSKFHTAGLGKRGRDSDTAIMSARVLFMIEAELNVELKLNVNEEKADTFISLFSKFDHWKYLRVESTYDVHAPSRFSVLKLT